MTDYGLHYDTHHIISGSSLLFRSGALADSSTAISGSTSQIIAITCSANYDNRLTKLTTMNANATITITSGSSEIENLQNDQKLILRYISDSDQTDRIPSASDSTVDHLLGGIGANIIYVDIPLLNNDDSFTVAYKTVRALTASVGYNKAFSASLVDDGSTFLISSSLGENMTIGSSFRVRSALDHELPNDYLLSSSGWFKIYSLNSGSVAIPDFSGTEVEVGGMQVGTSFMVGGGSGSQAFDHNIIQTGSGFLNQPFFQGYPNIQSASIAMQLDRHDKTSGMITGSGAAMFYLSSSGKMGIGTSNPTTEVDITADEIKMRRREDNIGIQMNSEGNLESFANSSSLSATGSEVILSYTRTNLGAIAANDVLGSIRWIAPAVVGGSEEPLNDRTAGAAASISVICATSAVAGVTSDMLFKVSQAGASGPKEMLRLGANGNVYVSGSLILSGSTPSDGEVYMSNTGHITASGNISASGFISASSFSGDGSNLTNLPAATSFTNITASGHILSSESIVHGNISASGNISATGHITSSGRIQTLSHITASGNISASGNIIGSHFTGSNLLVTASGASVIQVGNTGNTLSKWEWHRNGARKWVIYNDGRSSPSHVQDGLHFKAGLSSDADATHINMVLRPDQGALFYGNVSSSGNISASGDVIGRNILTPGNISASGNIQVTGHITSSGRIQTLSHITASGAISSSGVITGLSANIGNITATNVDTTNLRSNNRTAAATIADDTGVITIGSSVLTTTDINGGTIDGITSLTAGGNLDIGAHELRAATFESDIATGTAPLTVASTTAVTNLTAQFATTPNTNKGARHYGSTIKIIPTDFIQNEDGGVNKSEQFDDTGTIGVRATSANAELWCFPVIPEGMKATHVHIKGLDSGTDGSSADDIDIEVFEYSLSTGGITSKGTGVVGTNLNITDVNATATNTLAVRVDTADIDGSDTDVVYGGYVTIAAQ